MLMTCAAPTAWAVTTVSVSGSTLTVTGGSTADQITVQLPGGDGITPPIVPPPAQTDPYLVRDPAGLTINAGCMATANANEAACPRGGVAWGAFSVRIDGGAGNDWIQTIVPNQALGDLMLMQGGAGNDALFGSENEEVVMGGAGDDLIDAGAGGDFVSGGTINETSPGIVAPSFEGAVNQPTNYMPGPGAGTDKVYGGGFDDQMTDGDNDNATGQLNSDIVDGGVCATLAVPEQIPPGVPAPENPATPGAAYTTCPPLAANVDNPEDHDAIMLAHRTLALNIDVQVLTNTQGAAGEGETIRRIEAVWGGAGNDVLRGRGQDGFADDSLRGNGGNDLLDSRDGDDELIGGPGADTLLGGPGADVINPGSRIVSQTATATSTTSDGADHIDGGTNSTIIGGHSNTDLVTYEGRSEPIRIDFNSPGTTGAPGEGDTLIGIEDVMGGHRDDVIIGGPGPNLISGDPLPPIVNVPPDPPLPPGPPGGHFGNDHVTTRDDHADTVDCTEGTADVHIADLADASINCETLDRPPPPLPACNDKADNDGDGKVDGNDPGCESLTDTTEAPDPPTARQCADKKDNDQDGLIDYPSDPGCEAAGDNDETDKPVCVDAYKCIGVTSITGPSSAGRIVVSRNGTFRLPRHRVTCPASGADCAVQATTTAVVRTRAPKGKVSAKRKLRRATVRLGATRYAITRKPAAAASQKSEVVRGRLSKAGLAFLKRRKAIRSTVDVTVAWEGTTRNRKISVILKAPKKAKAKKKKRR